MTTHGPAPHACRRSALRHFFNRRHHRFRDRQHRQIPETRYVYVCVCVYVAHIHTRCARGLVPAKHRKPVCIQLQSCGRVEHAAPPSIGMLALESCSGPPRGACRGLRLRRHPELRRDLLPRGATQQARRHGAAHCLFTSLCMHAVTDLRPCTVSHA